MELKERKIVDSEDRLRRNNTRIVEISEKENETWDECKQEVQSLIKVKLGIAEKIVTERAHHIKKKGTVRIQENPEQEYVDSLKVTSITRR